MIRNHVEDEESKEKQTPATQVEIYQKWKRHFMNLLGNLSDISTNPKKIINWQIDVDLGN